MQKMLLIQSVVFILICLDRGHWDVKARDVVRHAAERVFLNNLHAPYDTFMVSPQCAWDCCECTLPFARVFEHGREGVYATELVRSLPHLRFSFHQHAI